MNIIRNILISAALILASKCPLLAQDSPAAWFVSGDEILCDGGIVNIVVGVKKDQQAIITIIERDMTTGTETKFSTNKEYPQDNKISINRSIKLRHSDKHDQYMLILNGYESTSDGKISLADTMMVDVWGTPTAKILNDTKICGYATTLEADDRWEDVSTYHWATTKGTLSNPDIRQCDIAVTPKEQTTFNVELTETTGNGKCISVDKKTITLVGSPKAEIHTDNQGISDTIRICTTVDGEEGYSFKGTIDLDGNAPYEVKLSNGAIYSSLKETHSSYLMSATKAQTLVIESVSDANGCLGTSDEVKGAIEIIDRKPYPVIARDTFEVSTEQIIVPIQKGGKENDPHWSVMDEYDELVEGWTYENGSDNGTTKFQARSTINGIIGVTYYEIETGEKYGLSECPSDEYPIWINIIAPLNAPNGISPNDDGKNDALIIEGLPQKNHIIVVDSRGKVVFEKDNYRNDWKAENVDDGYYVYVVESPGINTIRKTLVIKRSK